MWSAKTSSSSSAGNLNLEILERKMWPCFCFVSEVSEKKKEKQNRTEHWKAFDTAESERMTRRVINLNYRHRLL
jgi:hypothetical protein